MDKLNQLFFNHANTILITPNTRLAEYVSAHCVAYQPQIFSYDKWLKILWEKHMMNTHYLCIHPLQAHLLWEEIIQANNPFFFNVQGLINEIKKAWKLCHAWQIAITADAFNTNMDTEMFFQWALAYADTLEKKQWVDVDTMPKLLSSVLSHDAAQNQKIILFGFEQLSPMAKKLFDVSATEVLIFDAHLYKSQHVTKSAYISAENEMNAFANWAEHQLANPLSQTIACVVPNLHEKRNQLERVLRRHFSEATYTISAGHIFSSCTMIAQALKMLTMLSRYQNQQSIVLKDFYFLLDSRYFEHDHVSLAPMIKIIHARGNKALPLSIFIDMLKLQALPFAEILDNYLHTVLPEYLKPSEWTEIFQSLLLSLGWPGCHSLNSEEYQTRQRWFKLLKEYQSLDLLFELITFDKALLLLKQMASQVIFQPQKKNAQLHILGVLEAAGLHFDALWVMGMNDDQFPSVVSLNPFIPQHIQRDNQMPHATHEGEMTFSTRLIQHFIAGGDTVIFSYLSQKDDLPAWESPLIQSIVYHENTEIQSCEVIIQNHVIPAYSKPIPVLPNENIRGGTTLIKHQALCPFRAFAKHRLNAFGFEPLEMGLNERDRGNLVHSALEQFWKVVETQQQLLTYSTEALEKLIYITVQNTLEVWVHKKPEILNAFLKKLETQRLVQLLKKWISYEKMRPDFVISALEEACMLPLSGLILKIRADRIDLLPSGEKIVIDYKTGTLPSMTIDNRPENPQLLLYALADPAIKAWVFAQVKPADPQLKGQSAESIEMPNISGVKAIDWPVERAKWTDILTGLAAAFVAGDHEVMPKRPTTCDTCDLQGLCRI